MLRPRGLERLQLYGLLLKRRPKAPKGVLRDALRRTAAELGCGDVELLRRLKAALSATDSREDMVCKLERALRLDADCRQGAAGLWEGGEQIVSRVSIMSLLQKIWDIV